jgi:LysR family transcriptional activator of dmlA
MKNLDLNDVRTFVTIAQEGTLTAAANALHQPTSTVSRSLTRLEKALGISLMHRNARGLILTDQGKEYLDACRRSLRILREGGALLEKRRQQPSGVIKIACPVTMARSVIAPILGHFFQRYPDLQVELEPYALGWGLEPRDDIDIYFKLLEPKDSGRNMRRYPGTARALFASTSYVKANGVPETPDDLQTHACFGSGLWNLTCDGRIVTPKLKFRVITSDPGTHLNLTVAGAGIAILPLWMAHAEEVRQDLVPILPLWLPELITVCALFSGSSRLNPKVQVMLDFLTEYMGTEKDPRPHPTRQNDFFTKSSLGPTSGP